MVCWQMFYSASAFNQNLAGWNVARVLSMSGTFQSVSAFNQNVASWNTASVSTMTSVCTLRSYACGRIALSGVSSVEP